MLWRAVRRERRGLTCACCHGDGTARARRSQRLRRATRGVGVAALRRSLRASQRKRARRVGNGERPGSSTGATGPTEARGSCLDTTDGGPCLPLPRQQRHAGRGPRQHARSTSETPFAAWPEPDILTTELRAHFRLLRNGGRASVASASPRCGATRQPTRHPSHGSVQRLLRPPCFRALSGEDPLEGRVVGRVRLFRAGPVHDEVGDADRGVSADGVVELVDGVQTACQ